MNYTKALTVRKGIVFLCFQFSVLVLVAVITPLLGHNQAITGSIVNATIFISVVLLGPQSAILVGLVPSVVALSVGLLPAVLAPMIPFIMIGNTILVLGFNYLRQKNFWLGVIVASTLKFLFLFFMSSVVVNLILKQELAQKVSLMMSWPQLLTALGGGCVAYLFLRGIIKKKI